MPTIVSMQAFREALPLFADSNKYEDWMVTFWLDVAEKVHNADRWGDLLPAGIQLYVAHHIVADYNMAREAARGGSVGMRTGVISAESGDKVSASYDVGVGSEAGAGHFNTTKWGQRWWALAQIHGAGPIQSGVPSGGDGAFGAWAGPPYALW